MRILVVSDTHGHDAGFYQALEREDQIDLIVHCGDTEGSEYEMQEKIHCPMHVVQGNNDFWSQTPREIETNIAGKKVLITHGHYYYVAMSNERLLEEARARGFDIVMFGHTHRPEIDDRGDVTMINPGSLTFPRQPGRQCSYILMTVEGRDEVNYEIKYV